MNHNIIQAILTPEIRQNIFRQFAEHALNYGAKHGCTFAFVETMSFQAPDFIKSTALKLN